MIQNDLPIILEVRKLLAILKITWKVEVQVERMVCGDHHLLYASSSTHRISRTTDTYVFLCKQVGTLDLVLAVLDVNVEYIIGLRFQLLLPLQQQGCRNDDEGRPVFILLGRLIHDHSRDHLHGLSETHVVSQNTSLVLGLTLLVDHPGDAYQLVR